MIEYESVRIISSYHITKRHAGRNGWLTAQKNSDSSHLPEFFCCPKRDARFKSTGCQATDIHSRPLRIVAVPGSRNHYRLLTLHSIELAKPNSSRNHFENDIPNPTPLYKQQEMFQFDDIKPNSVKSLIYISNTIE